jgi:histidyl-tRNA synthetase
MSNNKKNKKDDGKFIAYENLDKIGEIAVYYGFIPSKSITITKSDMDATRDLKNGDFIDDETDKHGRLPLHVEEKIALIRAYQEENMQSLPQPVMLYFKDPCHGISKKDGYHRYADLEIIGGSGSIAEATLIQTARVILAQEGYTNTAVEVNSLGDHDSMQRFIRELTAYYRKHINDMSAECRQLFKEDPLELLSSGKESCKQLNELAPKSMDFLCENSRRHLEELLEYFEVMDIPYSINNSLIANRKYCTETIFAIVNTDPEAIKKSKRILAVGVRYNGLSKKLNLKREIMGVGISLLIKGNNADLRKTLKKTKRPIASFVQLGIESKSLSLLVIEKLRQAKIPLYLSLAKDRLGAQVSLVEKYHTPYVIVMGKKEAVDKVAIVRKNDTHAQEIVSLEDLPKYMKKVETDL